eukprot:gnl/TRDRNA2_/TRDRNA2_46583_c0_seq1.p1 gnl/TRDRNA2_/TRDRNA2_46583_c0~~gnl/TRDRNA2_/TRDRNA2_46583_c0_seq1.p1  ORF type:complete len:368 (+),score=54.54 gnl/TRDRNA2_/TRDRNA2_46583_c0_seq1:51-1154(+)
MARRHRNYLAEAASWNGEGDVVAGASSPSPTRRPLLPIIRSAKAFNATNNFPGPKGPPMRCFAQIHMAQNPYHSEIHHQARLGFRKPKQSASRVRLRPLDQDVSAAPPLLPSRKSKNSLKAEAPAAMAVASEGVEPKIEQAAAPPEVAEPEPACAAAEELWAAAFASVEPSRSRPESPEEPVEVRRPEYLPTPLGSPRQLGPPCPQGRGLLDPGRPSVLHGRAATKEEPEASPRSVAESRPRTVGMPERESVLLDRLTQDAVGMAIREGLNELGSPSCPSSATPSVTCPEFRLTAQARSVDWPSEGADESQASAAPAAARCSATAKVGDGAPSAANASLAAARADGQSAHAKALAMVEEARKKSAAR